MNRNPYQQLGGQTVCACIGPKNGEPLCPCAMRGVVERNGRWIKPEVDLGPVKKSKDDMLEEIKQYLRSPME